MNIDYCIAGNFDRGNIDDPSKFSLSIFFNCKSKYRLSKRLFIIVSE